MLITEQQKIIDKTIEFVKISLKNAEGGHDWWHVYRVWKLAVKIGEEEKADPFVVQLGSLLHDIADSKFNDGNEEIGPELASGFLKKQNVDDQIIAEIVLIIKNISFKNSFGTTQNQTLELKVIQDADRLDAIGAIGIARTFNYGGYKNFAIHDPDQKPKQYKSKDEYKKSDSPTVNHFYEKLFHLKGMMNTKTGKDMAEGRHRYMKKFLEQFYKEWEGER